MTMRGSAIKKCASFSVQTSEGTTQSKVFTQSIYVLPLKTGSGSPAISRPMPSDY